MKNKKFFLFLLICVLCFLAIQKNLEKDLYTNEDGLRHYYKTINKCELSNWNECETYPGGYHFITSFFVSNINEFKIFNILLFFLVYPVILFYVSKNIYTLVFYFISTNMIFYISNLGNYPSFLVIFLWLLFFYSKNLYFKAFLLLFSLLTHSSTLNLFIFPEIIKFIYYKTGFPIFIYYKTGFLRFLTNINAYFDYWTSSFFPLFSFIGFFYLIERKKFDICLIVLFSFFASVVNFRAIYPAVFLLLISFSDYFKKSSFFVKSLLFFSCIFYILILFSQVDFGFGGF